MKTSPTSYGSRAKIALHYLLPQHFLTRLAGWFAEKKWGGLTHFVIKRFAKAYNINWQEAEKSEASDYASFNDFFTRRLKNGSRPIDETENGICMPADGKVNELGRIHHSALLQAKGHSFTLEALLAGDKEMADAFSDGLFFTTYLSPKDYHRVHMPCRGRLKKAVFVPGDLFSVNPFLTEHVPNLFARNERLICLFETDFGPMIQILVGATITGSISTVWTGRIQRQNQIRSWDYPEEGDSAIVLEKGQEMGAFLLGSTVINLFPNNVELSAALSSGSETKQGGFLGIFQQPK